MPIGVDHLKLAILSAWGGLATPQQEQKQRPRMDTAQNEGAMIAALLKLQHTLPPLCARHKSQANFKKMK